MGHVRQSSGLAEISRQARTAAPSPQNLLTALGRNIGNENTLVSQSFQCPVEDVVAARDLRAGKPERNVPVGDDEPLDQVGEVEGDAQNLSIEEQNDATWGLVLESIEVSHQNDLADVHSNYQHDLKVIRSDYTKEIDDLRVAHASQIKELQEGLEKAKKRKVTVEKIGGKFKAKKEAAEADLRRRNEQLQQLQHRCDTLEVINCSENTRLGRIISERDQELASLRNAVNSSMDAIVRREQYEQRLRAQLAEAENANREMTTELVRSREAAEHWSYKAMQLGQALQMNPGCTNFDDLLAYKNRNYTDLESRAGECFTQLEDLERKSEAQKRKADFEIASLKIELREQNAAMRTFFEKKNHLKAFINKEVLKMRGQIRRDNFIDALSQEYDLKVHDNSELAERVLEQQGTISALTGEKVLWHNRHDDLKEERVAQDEAMANLESRERALDIDVGRLEIDLEMAAVDGQRAIQAKDAVIADLQQRIQYFTEHTRALIIASASEAARLQIEFQEREIASLYGLLQEAQNVRHRLEEYEAERKDLANAAAGGSLRMNIRHRNDVVRIAAAEVEIETLRGNLGWRNPLLLQEAKRHKQECEAYNQRFYTNVFGHGGVQNPVAETEEGVLGSGNVVQENDQTEPISQAQEEEESSEAEEPEGPPKNKGKGKQRATSIGSDLEASFPEVDVSDIEDGGAILRPRSLEEGEAGPSSFRRLKLLARDSDHEIAVRLQRTFDEEGWEIRAQPAKQKTGRAW